MEYEINKHLNMSNYVEKFYVYAQEDYLNYVN